MITIPMIPVRIPPRAKVIFDGHRLAKPLAGATTFAATLVVSVAMSRAKSDSRIAIGLSTFDSSLTGSQIASPKITAEAEVTATPMKANRVIVGGSPRNWPRTCACWSFA